MYLESEHALTTQIVSLITRVRVERGFVYPMRLVLVSHDGSVVACECNPGQFDIIAEHYSNVGEFLELPYNFMVVDARGEAASLVLETPKQTDYTIQ